MSRQNQSIIMSAFNQHLRDFIDDIQRLFPENLKLRTFKNLIGTFVKLNPKKPVEIWFTKVTSKYNSEILNEDVDFFLKKNYDEDIKSMGETGINMQVDFVEELREHIKNIDDDNRKMAIKYVKEMTQLSTIYFS